MPRAIPLSRRGRRTPQKDSQSDCWEDQYSDISVVDPLMHFPHRRLSSSHFDAWQVSATLPHVLYAEETSARNQV